MTSLLQRISKLNENYVIKKKNYSDLLWKGNIFVLQTTVVFSVLTFNFEIQLEKILAIHYTTRVFIFVESNWPINFNYPNDFLRAPPLYFLSHSRNNERNFLPPKLKLTAPLISPTPNDVREKLRRNDVNVNSIKHFSITKTKIILDTRINQ